MPDPGAGEHIPGGGGGGVGSRPSAGGGPKPDAPAQNVFTPEQVQEIVNREVRKALAAAKASSPDHGDQGAGGHGVGSKGVTESSPETRVPSYPKESEAVPLPGNTDKAVDKALLGMTKEWLNGEPGKGWKRGVMPLAIGFGAEALRDKGGVIKTIFDSIQTGAIGTKAGDLGHMLGGLVGVGTEAGNIASTFASAGALSAIITGVAMPSVNIAKRVLFGENAYRLAAKYMIRANEGGFFAKIIRGAESWAMKKVMFSEDRYMKKLAEWSDQNKDVSQLQIGLPDEIYNYVAAGMQAGATVRLLDEMGVEKSPAELDKMKRFNRMYEMASKLFDSKVVNPPERERVLDMVSGEIPNKVKNRERMMWMKQTGLMTAIGMAKSVTMVGLLEAISGTNLTHLGNGLNSIGKAIESYATTVGTNIGTWVTNTFGVTGGGGAGGYTATKPF